MNSVNLNTPVAIRTATPADAAEILAVYAPYVKQTAITFEYEVPSLEEFAGRIVRTLERYPYLVALSEGKIVGYAYVSPFHARPAYDWAVETSIYVRMDCKRMGIGHKLYEALEETLKRQGILNMEACIAYRRHPMNTSPGTVLRSMRKKTTAWWESFTSAVTNLTVGTIWSGWKSLLGNTKKTSLRLFHFRSCRKSFCNKIKGNARGWKT